MTIRDVYDELFVPTGSLSAKARDVQNANREAYIEKVELEQEVQALGPLLGAPYAFSVATQTAIRRIFAAPDEPPSEAFLPEAQSGDGFFLPPSGQQLFPPLKPGPLGPPLPESEALINADYFVISYGFNDGSDLDTRTLIRSPSSGSFLGPIGWCKDEKIGDYLQWGGDNTGTGVESVLLVKSAYLAEFGSSVSSATLELKANWFGQRGSNIRISITAYKGGEMIPSDYSWENNSASRVWTNLPFFDTNQVLSNTSDCVEGERVCLLTLDYGAGRIVYNR